MNKPALFISDLHLSTQRPDKVTLFEHFLKTVEKQICSLYILGDLFDDFWVGSDDDTPPNPEIMAHLKHCIKKGNATVYIMRGNRDFHLNQSFADKTGCQFIDDPTVITLNQKRILLMHGDTLCTHDKQYQQWRVLITNRWVKYCFSYTPLSLRKYLSHRVRRASVRILKHKPKYITDVDQNTVKQTMVQHDTQVLIHGHTHQQGMHELEVNRKKLRRIVLGDWYMDDCVLVHDNNGFYYRRIADYIAHSAKPA